MLLIFLQMYPNELSVHAKLRGGTERHLSDRDSRVAVGRGCSRRGACLWLSGAFLLAGPCRDLHQNIFLRAHRRPVRRLVPPEYCRRSSIMCDERRSCRVRVVVLLLSLTLVPHRISQAWTPGPFPKDAPVEWRHADWWEYLCLHWRVRCLPIPGCSAIFFASTFPGCAAPMAARGERGLSGEAWVRRIAGAFYRHGSPFLARGRHSARMVSYGMMASPIRWYAQADLRSRRHGSCSVDH